MSVSAYVLIQTEVGRSSDVTMAIREIDGFDEAHDVTGPYDVIARATADSMNDLGHLVVHELQRLAGVSRTITCPIITD
jgi:DNA-binding Lrp family transcriptional regulator